MLVLKSRSESMIYGDLRAKVCVTFMRIMRQIMRHCRFSIMVASGGFAPPPPVSETGALLIMRRGI